ncbi:MAG: DUF2142 domain-containing protein [Lachnospiraceae bacterium]|nr:DUF2142 domain-containing protein [Lachnospiraceae bacterium]
MKEIISKNVIFAISLLTALLFCVLWTHDHISGAELSSYFPDMGAEEMMSASDEREDLLPLDEGYSFELPWEWEEIKTSAFRLNLPDGAGDGNVTVTVTDEKGTELKESIPISEINEDSFTYFKTKGEVEPGILKFDVRSEGSRVLIYTRGVFDEEGVILYDGPQVKLTASSVPEKMLLGLIVLCFAGFAVLFLADRRRALSPEALFLFLYISFGLIFMLSYAPLAEPDSGNHFKRVLSITNGNPVGIASGDSQIGDDISWPGDWETDDNVNMTIYRSLRTFDFKMGENKPERLEFTNIALYSPFSYTAPVIGAFIARIFTDRLMVILFASRLSNLLITGLIMFLALRITPVGKRYILWIILLPMFMQQAVGVAPDSMLTALVTILLAMALRYRCTEESPGRWAMASLYGITFLLSQYKIVYLLFALMVFLIPAEKFGSRKRYVFHVCAMGGMTAAAALIWLKISSGILSTGYALADSQTEKMLTRPVEYMLAVFRTYATEGCSFVGQLLGSDLGSFAFKTNLTVLMILFSLFIAEVVMTRKSNGGGDVPRDRMIPLLLTCIMAATALLITTAEYIQWNDGINLILGIQGRYFLPFLFPLMTVICGDRKGTLAGNKMNGIYAHALILLCFVPQILLHYLYGTLD